MEVFLGVRPKGLWTLGLAVDDLHDDEPVPLSSMTVTDNRDLTAEALVASEMGKRYVSRSRAEEWGTMPTADCNGYLFGSTAFRCLTEEQRAERERAQAQLQEVRDSGLVDEVVAAGTSIGTDSDYGRNLTTALEAGFATEKMRGVVISVVAVYGRQQRETAKVTARQERVATAADGFIAPDKTRVRDVPVMVADVFESTRPRYAYPYGDEPFQIITMRESDGHEIMWKTGSIQDVETGDQISMTGSVKEHSQFRGVDQTVINRAKLEKLSGHGAGN